MIKRIIDFIKNMLNAESRFDFMTAKGFYDKMSDEEFIKKKYKIKMGKNLNLKNPKTYNEKLQWLKLYNHNPLYTKLVDKYEVKKYVAKLIGEEYIIPTLGVWSSFDEIDFEILPMSFVLKCTHDSGGLVIVKDKKNIDYKSAKKKLNRCLERNFYYAGREWPYKDVVPMIIAEKYIEDRNHELKDYKLMCFNGKVKCSFVCTERFSDEGLKVTFFDREWNMMPFERYYPKSNMPISKPINYEKMIELAEILSKDIPFVRVDFYEVDNKIYFGELTFYPGSGLEDFEPEEWDYTLGQWIEL